MSVADDLLRFSVGKLEGGASISYEGASFVFFRGLAVDAPQAIRCARPQQCSLALHLSRARVISAGSMGALLVDIGVAEPFLSDDRADGAPCARFF